MRTEIIPEMARQHASQALQRRADGARGDAKQARMREVAKEFEALMLESMVRAMRKNVPESPLLGESHARETFQEMLDSEYVSRMVDRGGIGIAELMVRQLSRSG